MHNLPEYVFVLWTSRGQGRVQSLDVTHKQCTDSTGGSNYQEQMGLYALFTPTITAQFSTPKSVNITAARSELYTLSTEPTITTTYINKGD